VPNQVQQVTQGLDRTVQARRHTDLDGLPANAVANVISGGDLNTAMIVSPAAADKQDSTTLYMHLAPPSRLNSFPPSRYFPRVPLLPPQPSAPGFCEG
jgi:hypothetical protein